MIVYLPKTLLKNTFFTFFHAAMNSYFLQIAGCSELYYLMEMIFVRLEFNLLIMLNYFADENHFRTWFYP